MFLTQYFCLPHFSEKKKKEFHAGHAGSQYSLSDTFSGKTPSQVFRSTLWEQPAAIFLIFKEFGGSNKAAFLADGRRQNMPFYVDLQS